MFFIILLALFPGIFALENVQILNDATALVGSNASLACKGSGVLGKVHECAWKSPSSIVYSGNDFENYVRGVRVSLFERSAYCILTIDDVSFEMSGAWECILKDSQRALGKFGFLRIFDPLAEDFQVISNFDQKEQSVLEGSDASLICKANHIVKSVGERATCIWINPNGKTFDVIGSRGEIYEYWPDGIVSIGNPDDGECGIKLKNARSHQSGTWTCQLIRKSPNGIGSQVTTGKIDLQVHRSARYELEDTIQGFPVGDLDVEISLTIPLPKDAHAISFFWIIQRKFLIYEGDQWFCPLNAEVCYLPKPRLSINRPHEKKAILNLIVSEVTPADIEEPIVLIMEYIDKNSKVNAYNYVSKVFKVPRRKHPRNPRHGITNNNNNNNDTLSIPKY